MDERRRPQPAMSRRAMLRGLMGAAGATLLAACGPASATNTRAPAADSAATATPAAAAAALAARAASPPPPARPVQVAATTTQIQDFVRNVGGSRVAVHGILKPNVDPHDYEPTVEDATTIGQADIIFVHGIGLDAWMGKPIKNANATAPVVTTTAGIAVLKGDATEAEGDPHVWFDPTLVQTMVDNIAAGLARVDPAGADAYQRNAQAYHGQLDRLDTQVRGIFDQVPREQRKLVTNHDAFQYLARRYGLTIVGAVIPSISDTAEPSAQDINTLIDTIKREHVKAIFAESSANPKVARQVAGETGITIVDTLYGDTLGAPGSQGATYLTMMVYDATTITNALK